jgi:hypothetical protein
MFRTAFPTASEDVERKEANWVKTVYDTKGANMTGKARFAGTWVSPEVALELAKEYYLYEIIKPLADAVPDPNIVYRKSQKTVQQPTPVASPISQPQPATSTSPRDAAPPSKRRREASPVTSPVAAAPAAALAATPARQAQTPPSCKGPISPSTSRWSTRLRSPAPAPATPLVPVTSPKTPRTAKAVREHLIAVQTGSDETVVEEEETEIVKVAQPNMEEDLREQKELVERLKAERAAAATAAQAVLSSEETTLVESTVQKRAREDDVPQYALDIKEPETEERALVSNSRIRTLKEMPPERKSLAWGALLFAAGLGAVYVSFFFFTLALAANPVTSSFLPSIPGLF